MPALPVPLPKAQVPATVSAKPETLLARSTAKAIVVSNTPSTSAINGENIAMGIEWPDTGRAWGMRDM